MRNPRVHDAQSHSCCEDVPVPFTLQTSPLRIFRAIMKKGRLSIPYLLQFRTEIPMPDPIFAFVLTPHALMELERRGIDEEIVLGVLAQPEQRIPVREGRDVLQSRLVVNNVQHLVRVFVDVDRTPAEVVTVYKTSKVDK